MAKFSIMATRSKLQAAPFNMTEESEIVGAVCAMAEIDEATYRVKLAAELAEAAGSAGKSAGAFLGLFHAQPNQADRSKQGQAQKRQQLAASHVATELETYRSGLRLLDEIEACGTIPDGVTILGASKVSKAGNPTKNGGFANGEALTQERVEALLSTRPQIQAKYEALCAAHASLTEISTHDDPWGGSSLPGGIEIFFGA